MPAVSLCPYCRKNDFAFLIMTARAAEAAVPQDYYTTVALTFAHDPVKLAFVNARLEQPLASPDLYNSHMQQSTEKASDPCVT